MIRYEILILTIPEITQDEGKKLESQFDQLVQAHKGSVISFERWGKYRLAYPVRKNEYGVYYLARFEAEDITALINEIKTLFSVKFYDIVMRNVVTRLDTESLTYQRPPSLEEGQSRDVGSFLSDSFSGGRRRSGPREQSSRRIEQSEDITIEEKEWKLATKTDATADLFMATPELETDTTGDVQ